MWANSDILKANIKGFSSLIFFFCSVGIVCEKTMNFVVKISFADLQVGNVIRLYKFWLLAMKNPQNEDHYRLHLLIRLKFLGIMQPQISTENLLRAYLT